MDGRENKEIFFKHGLKNTRHRNLIYELMKQNEFPLTLEDIFKSLREADPSVSFSTVYRTLEAFADKGIAIKTSIGSDSRAAFELNRLEHRHHLICVNCKKMVAIDGCPLDRFEKSLERKTQFDITAHRLELFGYCPACKVREDQDPS